MTKAHCKAKTAKGKPCKMAPLVGSDFCFNHNPDKARERAVARKRGGESRHTPHYTDLLVKPEEIHSLEDARRVLIYVYAEVSGMENSLERARVLLAWYEMFRKSVEIGELEQRIAALEARRK